MWVRFPGDTGTYQYSPRARKFLKFRGRLPPEEPLPQRRPLSQEEQEFYAQAAEGMLATLRSVPRSMLRVMDLREDLLPQEVKSYLDSVGFTYPKRASDVLEPSRPRNKWLATSAPRVAIRWAAEQRPILYYHARHPHTSFGSRVVELVILQPSLSVHDPVTFLYSRNWSVREDGVRVDHVEDGGKHYYMLNDKAFTMEEFDDAFRRGQLPDRIVKKLLSQPRFRGATRVQDFNEAQQYLWHGSRDT